MCGVRVHLLREIPLNDLYMEIFKTHSLFKLAYYAIKKKKIIAKSITLQLYESLVLDI